MKIFIHGVKISHSKPQLHVICQVSFYPFGVNGITLGFSLGLLTPYVNPEVVVKSSQSLFFGNGQEDTCNGGGSLRAVKPHWTLQTLHQSSPLTLWSFIGSMKLHLG
jgi:hypothetical protein